MPTIELRAELSTNDLVRAAEQLDSQELEELVGRLLLLRARRHAPALSKQETALMTRVNQALPSEVMRRYQELIARRAERSLSPEELSELIQLSDRAEALAADRTAALVDLSQLRQVSLDDLVNELGIRPVEIPNG